MCLLLGTLRSLQKVNKGTLDIPQKLLKMLPSLKLLGGFNQLPELVVTEILHLGHFRIQLSIHLENPRVL